MMLRFLSCCMIICGLLVSTGFTDSKGKIVWFDDFEKENAPFLKQKFIDSYMRFGELKEICRTDEMAYSGRYSVKIDVNITRQSTNPHWMLPVSVPLASSSRISMKVWTQRAYPILTVTYIEPEKKFKRSVWIGRKEGYSNLAKPLAAGSSWREIAIETSRIKNISKDAFIESIGLYFDRDATYTKDTGRALTYIDDISIRTQMTDAQRLRHEMVYRAYLDKIKQEQSKTLASNRIIIQQTQKEVLQHSKLVKLVDKKKIPKCGGAGEMAAKLNVYLNEACLKLNSLYDEAAKHLDDKQLVEQYLHLAREYIYAADSLVRLKDCPADFRNIPFWIGQVPATGPIHVIPGQFPYPAITSYCIEISACRSEYEPASFVLVPSVNLTQVRLKPSSLVNGAGDKIPASNVELFWVAVWWQAGYSINQTNSPRLVPELLVKNPDFVKYSGTRKRPVNILLPPSKRKDSHDLLPAEISVLSPKQVWMRFHIPENAKEGVYRGHITISYNGLHEVLFPVIVTVHSFDLAKNRWDSAIYYRGRVASKPPEFAATLKTKEQMLKEFKNIRQHGIDTVTSSARIVRRQDGILDFSELIQDLELRRKADLLRGPVPLLNTSINFSQFTKLKNPKDRQKAIRQAVQVARELQKLSKNNAYPEFLIYTLDEAHDSLLIKQAPLMKAIVNTGAKLITACQFDYYKTVGDYIYCPIINKMEPSLRDYLARQKLPRRVWVYGRPQGGVENPDIYRRNYGLMLWANGENGACTYAYQDAFPEHSDCWDDFSDSINYRNHMMTYPTLDGVVDTIQWEGYRESIDDLRYLSTLLDLIQQNKINGSSHLIDQIEEWLSSINVNTDDLDKRRAEMVGWIQKLNESMKSPN